MGVPLPNVTGTIEDSSGVALPGARIDIQRRSADGWMDRYLMQATTSADGTFGVVLDSADIPHGFALVVHPPESDFSYGAPTQVNRSDTDTSEPLNLGSIRLKAANAQGRVLGSNGTPLSQVYIGGNTDSGQQIAGTVTTEDGKFGLFVPGQVSVNAPARLGVWLQDEQRFVQFPITSLPFSGDLRVPEVNLLVQVTDGDSGVPEAQVNLLRFNGSYDEWVDGGRTDANGQARFAVDDTTVAYVVEVQPPSTATNLATTRVESVPSPLEGGEQAQIVVPMLSPNTEILILDPGGNPIQDAYVYVRDVTSFQGVGVQTGADGKARISLSDPDGLFEVFVSPPWYARSVFAEQRLETTLDTSTQPARLEVTLQNPNLSLFVQNPVTNAGLRHAQIEVRYAGDPWGFIWSNTDQFGSGALQLEPGSYDLVISPSSWEVGSSAFGPKAYQVVVDAAGTTSVTTNGEALLPDDDGIFSLSVSSAQFSSTVEAGGTPVANAWIEVQRRVGNDQEYYFEWVTGTSTSRDGKFGLTLADGTYFVRAQPAWGDRTYAPSVRCTLVISGGTVDPSGVDSCSDKLYLRSPNLAFTVTDGSNPISNAWACPINTQQFNCVASARDGLVTFYIDDTESILDDSIIIRIDAPWGSTNLAGRNLEVPKSEVATAAWSLTTLVALAAPNVVINVRLGSEQTVATDGWVSIVRESSGEWLGGAAISRQGSANFNLTDRSGTYCVEVWPGWNVRRTYGPTRKCGVTLSDGVENVTLKTANVRTQVIDTDGRLNAHGWVSIEGIGSTTFSGGVPLNEAGRLAAFLDDGVYELTFYPAWARSGTQVTVTVTVSSGVSDIGSEISLSAGNVLGIVTLGGSPSSGVIVVARSSSATYTGVTGSDGAFRIGLPEGEYTLSVISLPGDSRTAGLTVTAGGTLSGNFPSWTLAVGD